jgi:hypothetical protein
MATSKTDIANMAIAHIGTGIEIANLDTESSEEAAACRRFFNTARRATLRDADWSFATKFVALGLIAENPTTEWNYSYTYPSDAVKLRRIVSGVRNDTRQTRVPYKIASGASSSVIYTDQQNAVLEYTTDVEDTSRFPSDFDLALSYRLAMFIAPRVSKGDIMKLKKELYDLYRMEVSQAAASTFNEQQSDEVPESEFTRGRE